MMNRHFRLNSELSGAIAERIPHAKNHVLLQSIRYIYIYIYIYTVEPVYNGHRRDWTKLAVIHR